MSTPRYEVVVLGAGPAGMMAATRAAERGKRTLLVEKNNKPGVKVLISGGTRCNLTHDASADEVAEAFARLGGKRQARFLRHALHRLPPESLLARFSAEGLATKVEPTGKVFPESDRALDVQRALVAMLHNAGAELSLGEAVEGLETRDHEFLVKTNQRAIACDRLIVAVGGRSYPGCGTTGDGYAWAKSFGHRITPPRPALAPLTSTERWSCALQGVTLGDVRVRLCEESPKPVLERRGSFLFTHFGLSGPAVMDSSRFVTERPGAGGWRAVCDFVPALEEQQILAVLKSGGGRSLAGALTEWAPRRLTEALIERAGAPPDRALAELTRGERRGVVDGLKRCAIPIAGTLGFKKAEVTAGGVDLAEINPRTMESRLQSGLYFCGEVLDVDGPIGGYNFQAAFSTGALAGESV